MDIEEFLQYCPVESRTGPKRAAIEAWLQERNRDDAERREYIQNCVNAIAGNPRLCDERMLLMVADGTAIHRSVMETTL